MISPILANLRQQCRMTPKQHKHHQIPCRPNYVPCVQDNLYKSIFHTENLHFRLFFMTSTAFTTTRTIQNICLKFVESDELCIFNLNPLNNLILPENCLQLPQQSKTSFVTWCTFILPILYGILFIKIIDIKRMSIISKSSKQVFLNND